MRRALSLQLLQLAFFTLAWFGAAPVAEAAWGAGGGICSSNSKVSAASLTCTVSTENFEAGSVAVLLYGGDNLAGGADSAASPIASVSDSGGNAWTVQGCWNNTQGGAGNGTTVCLATSLLATALNSGSSTITVNLTANVVAKTMRVREFTVAIDSSFALAGAIQVLSNDGADPGPMTVGGLTSAEYLFVRASALERNAGGAWTATAGFTTTGCEGTSGGPGVTNMKLCGEYRIITATTQTSDPSSNNLDIASLFIALREVGRTRIADGVNPADAALAPGAAITDLDAFTLRASIGTDSVTALTVTLTGAGSFAGVGEVRITSNDNATTYFAAVANPGSNIVSFSGGTPIPVSTTTTAFKVRITPRTHVNMPAPDGATYVIGGTVTAFTTTNAQLGVDAASATITVDNNSPDNVSGAACTAAAGQVSLAWSNPLDADFNSVLVLRRAGAAVGDTPVEGVGYVAGNTIGTSTVICATNGTSCSDPSLVDGTAYHYRIFSRDTIGNYAAAGVVPTGSPCYPASSFNVVDRGANPVTGVLKTKVTGQPFNVDISALSSANASITFNGSVKVELVDNAGGGACSALPPIQYQAIANQSFSSVPIVQLNAVVGSNAYPNVKFRVSYPASGAPTIVGCSLDAFALRPQDFAAVLVRDATRTTAGTANSLTSTANPGSGVVHNAGRPFRIDATARDSGGATTNLYTGQPVAVVSQCGVAAVCPASPGTLATGAWSASLGVITTTTATYNDVGSFNLSLEDRSFADVDLSDGSTTAERYIVSAAPVTAGRFVPDFFAVSAGSAITPRSDIPACSGSSFTYMGERMDLAFTLTARAYDGGAGTVTPNYTGTLGALALNNAASWNFGAIDAAAPTPLTARLDTALVALMGASWGAGTTTIAAPVAVTRAATPDGPYGALRLGVAPGDPDGVTLAAFDLDADNSGTPERKQIGGATALRFGRLRMSSASGAPTIGLRVPVEIQYWNGAGFATNALDSCTTLARGNFALGSYRAPLNACETRVSQPSVAFAAGVGTLTLAAPGSANAGSVVLTPQLGATASGNFCDLVGGAEAAASPAIKTYLQGNWGAATYNQNPAARASFGVYGAQPRNFIFFRENY